MFTTHFWKQLLNTSQYEHTGTIHVTALQNTNL